MNTKKKTLTRAVLLVVLFAGLLCGLLWYLFHIFDLNDDKHAEQTFTSFYAQKKGSLDGIYLGSSAAYRYWIPTQAFDDYGMSIFNLGTGSQPVVLQKYLIEEALRTQPDMKVILIDIRSIVDDNKNLKEADIRRVTDCLPLFSATRIRAVNTSLDYFQSMKADISFNRLYYYCPFLLYHNRWADDFTQADLKPFNKHNRYKGFVMSSNSTTPMDGLVQPTFTTETAQTQETKTAVLQDLLQYCEGLDQRVIFVSSPYEISEENQRVLNSYVGLVQEAGFTFLNFNTAEMNEELGLDYSQDFLDEKHVNYYGAAKYTAWIAKYLSQNLSLTDHREDETYASWTRSSELLAQSLDTHEQSVREAAETAATRAQEAATKAVSARRAAAAAAAAQRAAGRDSSTAAAATTDTTAGTADTSAPAAATGD